MRAMRQIAYISQLADTVDEAALRQIVAISRRNNRRSDLTGLLVSSGRYVLQVLEGEAGAVDATLRRIEADPRHHDLRILLDRPAATRGYPDWAMACVYNLDLADELVALFDGHAPASPEALLARLRPDSAFGTL
jgi:hypothetical protein